MSNIQTVVPWDIVGQIISHIGTQPKFKYYAYVDRISRKAYYSLISYEFVMGLRVDESSRCSSAYYSFEICCGDVIRLPYCSSESFSMANFIEGKDIGSLRVYMGRNEDGSSRGIPLDYIPGLPKFIEIVQKNKNNLFQDEIIAKLKQEVPEIGWNF